MIPMDQIEEVPIEKIHPNAWNPRKQTDREFKALTLSIEERGQLLPVRVRHRGKEEFEIIGGYHTFLACKKLKQTHLWIIDEGEMDEKEAKLRSLQDNVHGEDMPFEWAAVIHDLTERGMSLTDIAERVGKPKIELEDALKVLDLSAPSKALEDMVNAPHLLDIEFILDSDTKTRLDEIATRVGQNLKPYKARIVHVEQKINKARQSVSLFSVAITEPQKEIIEQALEQIMEQEECTRSRALELICADSLAGTKPATKEKQKGGANHGTK